MRKLISTIAVAAILLLATGLPARADSIGGGETQNGVYSSGNLSPHYSNNGRPWVPGDPVPDRPCDPNELTAAQTVYLITYGQNPGLASFHCAGPFFFYTLTDGTTGNLCLGCQTVPVVVDPVALAQYLIDQKDLPLPAIGMSPPAGVTQLVNLPTWLWIDPAAWRPVTASVTFPGEFVSTTATPVRVEWSLSDGSTPGSVVCPNPGTPYNPALSPNAQSTRCSYTYRNASPRSTVVATVIWQVSWQASGYITDGGPLPDLPRSAITTTRVEMAEAIN